MEILPTFLRKRSQDCATNRKNLYSYAYVNVVTWKSKIYLINLSSPISIFYKSFRSFQRGTVVLCRSKSSKVTSCHSWRFEKNSATRPTSPREFLLRNVVGKTCLMKEYILLYECIQILGKKNFWNNTLAFWVGT